MSTVIKYTNELGSVISAQQQVALTNFSKLTFISAKLKMVEIFEQYDDTNFKQVKYFLDDTEDKNSILNQHTDSLKNQSCTLYFNKQTTNGFDLWDWESYSKDAALTFKGKNTFDNKGRLIFSCAFDLISNSLQSGAFKNYYGNQFLDQNEDLLLHFFYNSYGELDLIFDVHGNYGYEKGISLNQFLEDQEFSQIDFPWDSHPYYHQVTPYLPVGSL